MENMVDPNIPAPQSAPEPPEEITEEQIQALVDALSSGQRPPPMPNTEINYLDADGVVIKSQKTESFKTNRDPQSIDIPKGDAIKFDSEKLAPGLEEERKFRQNNFTEQEITENREIEIEKLKANNFTEPEIAEYYGVKEPDMAKLHAHFTDNFKASMAAEAAKQAGTTGENKPEHTLYEKAHPADGILQAFEAGFQSSPTGLFVGGLPDKVLPEDAPRAMKLAAAVGDLLGSAIPFGAGMIGGSAVGGPIVGAATGFAVNDAYRQILIDHYTKGDITSAADFADRAVSTLWQASKGFVVGGATAFVGGKVGAKVLTASGSALMSDTARLAAELPVMVGLAKGLEGELPNLDDFIVGGMVLGGLHGGKIVGRNMMEIYKKTGAKPQEIIDAAKENPQILDELLADNANVIPFKRQGGDPLSAKADAALAKELKQESVASPPTIKEQVKEISGKHFDNFYQHVFDALAPAKQHLGEDIYKTLYRQKAWGGTHTAFMELGTVDYKNPSIKTGEPFQNILVEGLNAVKGKEVSAEGAAILSRMDPEISKLGNESKILSAFLIARTAVERAKKTPGKATGVDVEAAKKFLKQHPELDPVAKRYTEFGQRVLKYGDDAKIFNEGGYEAMKAVHENHASLARLMEADPLTGEARGSGKPVKKFKGDADLLIKNPIVTQMENAAAIIRAAEQNRSRMAIAERVRELSNPEVGEVVKAPPKALKISSKEVEQSKEVRDWLEESGLEGLDLPVDAFTIFRRSHGKLASNEIEVQYGSKTEVIKLRQNLADGIKSLNYDPPSTFLALRAAQWFAKTSAQISKKSITSSMSFAERNLVRDQFEGFINVENNPIATIGALGHVIGKDAVYRNWLTSGGLSEGFYDTVKSHIKFDKAMRQQGVYDNVWNTIKSPVDSWNVYLKNLNAIEQAPRVAAAKKAGLMNGSFEALLNAGYAGNESTVNFNRVGLSTKKIQPYFKFLAPGLAGIDRNIKGLANPDVWERGFYALTIPTVVNWMKNKDDSRYRALPSYKLAFGYPIMTDDWQPAVNGDDWNARQPDQRRITDGKYEVNNGSIHFIPKPPTYGLIFSTIPEAILNSFYDKHPEAFKDMEKQIIDSLLPDLQFNIAVPFLEKAMNRNLFTGNPIVPDALRQALPEDRQVEYTSETAKIIGRLIGKSPLAEDIYKDGVRIQDPVMVDTFIRDWTGPTGVELVKIADKMLHAAGIGNQTAEPYQSLFENPYVNGFAYRFPNARIQEVETFYKRINQNTVISNSLGLAMRTMNEERLSELQAEYGQSISRFSGMTKAMSAQTKLIKAIKLGKVAQDGRNFKSMGSVEKRQLIDTIYYQMWQTAHDGNRLMDEVEAQMKAQQSRP